MVNLIAEQQVARRKKSPRVYNALNHRTTGTDFIRLVKQKPARIRRPRTAAPFFFNRPAKPSRKREQPVPDRNRRESRKNGPGFSFPIPSLATIAVVAGTLVISLLALNWDGLAVSFPRQETTAFQPGPDEEGQRNLASYAGLPSFSAETETAAAVTVTAAATAASAAPETDEEIPLDLTETFTWSAYQVQKGDSVSKIAAKFGLSMDAVIASNNISNARRLREGETLRIPNMDGVPYTVKKGDSLSKISASMGVPLEVILDVNDMPSDAIQQGDTLFLPGARMAPEALKLALGELFIKPVSSRVTSQFGWRISPITGERHFHAALDLAGSIGTTVKAAMDGTVSTVGFNPTFGKFVIISHDGGYQSMYAHLSAVSIRQGERVNQGGKIGEVGNTGLTTGPHLHFAVYKNGRAVNPLELLN